MILHDILNMGWPTALAITAVAVCLTVNWNIRRFAKLDAAYKAKSDQP